MDRRTKTLSYSLTGPKAESGERMSDVEAMGRRAAALGLCALGVARPEPGGETADLRRFVEEGRHGGMGWLAREPEVRADPRRLLDGVRSVVVVGARYPIGDPPAPSQPLAGRLARYARMPDYHELLTPQVRALADDLGDPDARVYVDTGPVMEKVWAQRAGLGWIGRQSHLISRRFGCGLLLGVILTRVELPATAGHVDRCGRCRRCVDACPTGAVTLDGQEARFDARRCRSYWTIEHRGAIPEPVRPTLGDALFGCDACLESCPWNRFAGEQSGAPSIPGLTPHLPPALDAREILALDGPAFRRRFGGTPLVRARRRGLLRNAAVVLGNAGGPDAIPALQRSRREEPDPVVREHVAWALERLGRPSGTEVIP